MSELFLMQFDRRTTKYSISMSKATISHGAKSTVWERPALIISLLLYSAHVKVRKSYCFKEMRTAQQVMSLYIQKPMCNFAVKRNTYPTFCHS